MIKVIFSPIKSIAVFAKRWAEDSGLVVFFDERNKVTASMSARNGIIIEEADGKRTILLVPKKRGKR